MAAVGPSEAVTEATVQPNITMAVCEDIHSCVRELIKGIIFTCDVNASSPADQKRIIKDTINKAVHLVPSVQGKFLTKIYLTMLIKYRSYMMAVCPERRVPNLASCNGCVFGNDDLCATKHCFGI
jgi:hypothetical protein